MRHEDVTQCGIGQGWVDHLIAGSRWWHHVDRSRQKRLLAGPHPTRLPRGVGIYQERGEANHRHSQGARVQKTKRVTLTGDPSEDRQSLIDAWGEDYVKGLN